MKLARLISVNQTNVLILLDNVHFLWFTRIKKSNIVAKEEKSQNSEHFFYSTVAGLGPRIVALLKLCLTTQPTITCSKLTIKTLERRHWRRSGVFIVTFEHITYLVLVFLMLTLSRKMSDGVDVQLIAGLMKKVYSERCQTFL